MVSWIAGQRRSRGSAAQESHETKEGSLSCTPKLQPWRQVHRPRFIFEICCSDAGLTRCNMQSFLNLIHSAFLRIPLCLSCSFFFVLFGGLLSVVFSQLFLKRIKFFFFFQHYVKQFVAVHLTCSSYLQRYPNRSYQYHSGSHRDKSLQ